MRFASALFALALAACSPSNAPQTGSQTNWLKSCDSSTECGIGLECVCGACTATCLSDAACADLPEASCVAASDRGSIALCDGQAPPINLCLPRCTDDSCADGASCIAGVCMPTGTTITDVTVDADAQHQTLIGFGASLAYAEDRIAAHPDKEALYDRFFEEAGLDVLRIRNRQDDGEDPLTSTVEIVDAVAERLGHTPTLFMTSPTPPVALKANASRTCAGDPEACTLVTLPSGEFDYAGFANYWRSALEAYADAGITPDYISIQNHPNWIAPADVALDACLFLPEEGTTMVSIDGTPTEVRYPGYREALDEVKRAIADLPVVPLIGAPEAGVEGVGEFVTPLGASAFDALAFHAYGIDPAEVDIAPLEAVRELAEERDSPVLQTEMQTEGLDTAVMIHHAVTAANASAYLQNDLTLPNSDTAGLSLALLTDDAFELQDTYYAFSHYARRTDPGWIRVEATASSAQLLSSAWLSPDQGSLTVVLVNPSDDDLETKLVLPAALGAELTRTAVTRTVFNGLERSAALGGLPASGIVRVPSGSIATVSFEAE
jgi:glucuronoarabinoxylan endo-1,4-beta-xylanase